MSLVDLAPTLLTAAGLDVPAELDGQPLQAFPPAALPRFPAAAPT